MCFAISPTIASSELNGKALIDSRIIRYRKWKISKITKALFLFSIIFNNLMSDQRKKIQFLKLISATIIILIWIYLYFGNLLSVPFHPDESTQIFMSQDLELIFNNTSELILQSSQSIGLQDKYRLLDAPIPKYLIGISRIIFKQEALAQDWDWAKSWSENLNAIPNDRLLVSSRLIISLLFIGSTLLIYFLSKSIFPNNYLSIIAIHIFFSFNALILLHTRRAMAEGALIFFLLLSLYSFNKIPPKWIWLAAIPVSLAINAKQNLIFLVLIGIILIFYYHGAKLKYLIINLGLFVVSLFGVWYCFNPIAWKEPLIVAKLMITQRRELSSEQFNAIESVTPEFALKTVNGKLIALVAQSFILPPAPQDVSNYETNLEFSIKEYFQNPLHRGLFRNFIGGTFIMLFTLVGLGWSFFVFPKKTIIIISLSYLLLVFEIIVFINIPFQRYYLPLIPFNIIFSVFGIVQLFNFLKQKKL